MKHIAVFDIGKTNLKLAVVDLTTRTELAVETRPNRVLPGPPWPHFDTDAQWEFLIGALRRAQSAHNIDGIVVTTHGACAALLDRDGDLAAPVLDYEHPGPESLRTAYDAIRPPFSQTGSPPLPMGLNLGAQLHWQLRVDPGLSQRIEHVVTWPQYWGFRLTGALACDLSSLGCHTDLWAPETGSWSDLPARLGLGEKFAPPRRPGEVLGMVRPDIRHLTGLGDIPVLCGIHDSNASLLPHLATRDAPFSVVSTGTWVVAMAVGAAPVTLDPQRDTLININAFGAAVPSARFMGGREYDLLTDGTHIVATEADAIQTCLGGVMLLPSVVTGSGPFRDLSAGWAKLPETPEQKVVAIGYYLALMTAECLTQIGAQGPTMIEGPFSANPWFRSMLAAATGRAAVASADRTGTALGAALLFSSQLERQQPPEEPVLDPRLIEYAAIWRKLTAAAVAATTAT